MADIMTNSYTLKIDTKFVDGDTRMITLKNPKSDISESQITTLNSYLQSHNILIGDKTGATFGKITTVTRVQKQTLHLDLS